MILGISAVAPATGVAQVNIDFETQTGYTGVSMYDCWEKSPFRTGELKGNCLVVDNPYPGEDELSGKVHNGSAKVLGAQRSRFGSNTFGVRVDLETPFEFSTTTQYVHVNLLRPVTGRVMLVGLGRRRDWAEQPNNVEQFWVMSKNAISANSWGDAVFELTGSGNIDIHSLILVPECESPHNAKEDFLFYIDNIVVNSSATPSIATAEPYQINYSKTLRITSSTSSLTSIDFTSSDGTQTVNVDQKTSRAIYKYDTTKALTAKAGDEVLVKPNYSGSSIPATVYIDLENNGRFDIPAAVDGKVAPGRDLMAYSYLGGVNSIGETAATTSCAVPKFKIPADLKPGAYRMRVKMDYNSVDPMGENKDNKLTNRGSFTDVMLFIHDGTATVNDFQLNGEVLAGNGDKLSSYKAEAGKPFTIKMNPEKGFYHDGADVVSGFNIDESSNIDRWGNIQYFKHQYRFEGETFELPGSTMVGSVRIEGRMIEDKGEEFRGIDPKEYGLNFPETLPISRTDRALTSFTLSNGTTAKTFNVNTSTTIWQDLTQQGPLVVKPGDRISTNVNYAGSWMHIYQYVDWNRDRKYDNTLAADGTPAGDKELVAYTHYKSHNSLGETVDANLSLASNNAFTVPADQKGGLYNARFKIDWDNIDPKGQYASGGSNNIDHNGGYIVDFYIQVEGASAVEELASEGSLVANGVVGGIELSSSEKVAVSVYDAAGRLVHKRKNFKGTVTVPAVPGVYMVNEQKVLVK